MSSTPWIIGRQVFRLGFVPGGKGVAKFVVEPLEIAEFHKRTEGRATLGSISAVGKGNLLFPISELYLTQEGALAECAAMNSGYGYT